MKLTWAVAVDVDAVGRPDSDATARIALKYCHPRNTQTSVAVSLAPRPRVVRGRPGETGDWVDVGKIRFRFWAPKVRREWYGYVAERRAALTRMRRSNKWLRGKPTVLEVRAARLGFGWQWTSAWCAFSVTNRLMDRGLAERHLGIASQLADDRHRRLDVV